MTIELFVFPPSPRAVKVLSVAHHLGIPYALRRVDLFKGEHRAPGYAAMNPNMRMPTLRDGDYTLWESGAIQQYLALQRPESGLLPLQERARLDVTRWQLWDQAHWDANCAIFVFERVIKPRIPGQPPEEPAAIARGEEGLQRAARVLDAQLAGRRWVTGDSLTVADFALAAPLSIGKMAGLPLDGCANIQRWYGDISALPGWAKALQLQAG